jgi:hypothetical protein
VVVAGLAAVAAAAGAGWTAGVLGVDAEDPRGVSRGVGVFGTRVGEVSEVAELAVRGPVEASRAVAGPAARSRSRCVDVEDRGLELPPLVGE